MFLRVTYRDQQPIMRALYRLRKEGKLTPDQALWFRPTKPAEELFDVKNDPHELNNLVGNQKYAQKLQELRTKCQRWVTSFEDTGLIPETELKEKLRPDGKELKVAQPKIIQAGNKVTLSCATESATLGYKLNNNSPNADDWTIYTGPFDVAAGDTLKVVADRIGYRYSALNEVVIAER